MLRLRVPPPDWELATCLGQAPPPWDSPWFDNTDDGGKDETEWARDVCNGTYGGPVCPVRHECLLFALTNNETRGVWGGTSEADRRAIRRMWPWDPHHPAEPRPEWEWYPPGEVAAMLRARGIDNTEEEDEDDDDEGTEIT